MTRLLMAAVGIAVLGMAAPASAADMPVKAPPPAPLPVIYNWSGFYIGANGGWGQSHNCVDFVTAVGTVASGCGDRSGGLVGGQIGYRWQANQFVFGLEAQGDWADLSNTRVSLLNPTLSTTVKTDGIGLFTAQLGWAWNASLLYVKGGAAVTSNRLDVFDNITGLGLVSASNTRWGGTVGVGWEYGFAPNWSVGVEYDHLWMGNANNSFSVLDPRLAAVLNDRISQDVDMVTVRFNYRFGGYTAPGRY
ncbi:outer membrane protein [Bradyrhizobium lablabi]|uniref:outer membrane protein n=1 Tax=Bradyrhizobium lablabi TaxID=722472 RepID=UPI001BA8EB42|nr:outer membrane beta-barrel protein [Bradyrhizobium lablabi]MBR0692819.1 porin family protein [Bradyrhizobium lablabi]